jgi:NAD(P)-dependent dehydrogenase (short-subunit alcohol dehydrogenase family)
MVDRAIGEYGRLDMAFNNAGIQVPPSDAADESFERVTAVNQRGVWACMKHELRMMRDQGSGAIVNCSGDHEAAVHRPPWAARGGRRSRAVAVQPRRELRDRRRAFGRRWLHPTLRTRQTNMPT